MVSVILVEDVEQDRKRITALLKSHSDMLLWGCGRDGYDAIKLVRIHKPDIAIISLKLNFYRNVEISCLVKADSPETSVVFMSAGIDTSLIKASIKGRASAYLLKEEDMGNLIAILRKVKAGEMYISPRIGGCTIRLLEEIMVPKRRTYDRKKVPEFSSREMDIIIFISRGDTDKEIADHLDLKDGTVRNYVSRLKKKAGIRTRVGLVRYAIETGLASPSVTDTIIRRSKKREKPVLSAYDGY